MIFVNIYIFKTIRELLPAKTPLIFPLLKHPPEYFLTKKSTYVNVCMKWKKDPYYDSIESIHRSSELKSLISLKNCIARDPNGCIPISEVSKSGREFGLSIKVARFMRLHPSVFEEFVGPHYNLPWFRLTPKAVEIDREEKSVYEECKRDLRLRLKKFIMMSREKRLPLKIIQGLQWYLGLPDDFLENPESHLDGSFVFVEMEGGERGLAVDCGESFLSVLQKNAVKREVCRGEWNGFEAIPFPLFPSKGLRLKKKISDWLDEFQNLPYISPYEDFSHLNPESDVAEKRVVGVLHELLSLFVNHAAERKKLFTLKKYLGLPQKVHKAFERHPHIFYLSFRNKTCTAILKEAYKDKSAMEVHPLSRVRMKYIELMNQSPVILKLRRQNNRPFGEEIRKPDLDLDLDCEDEESSGVGKCSL
ncbi:hypothetical protein Nepgr_001261 [Nepenthes gracilis]|uniref:PORR domain-containing protein n=1 Tax=Nepenthes gracilis TaxID=150966 RepID=A0AAD3P889_NEPGR|nr:hypothetical protein Nepgr_001261 [Nepenthes gracilis]